MITNIRLTRASPEDFRTGLLGYVAARLVGGVDLDGITVRRTRAGRIVLSYPVRRDGRGHEHPYVRLGPEVHRELERRVFEELDASRDVAP